MAQAQEGNTVKVHYTGRLEDGAVFDSSRDRDPIEFTLGAGKVIPGFESAVSGMEVGEEKTTTIPATEAYGPRRDELLLAVEKERLPDEVPPEEGRRLQVMTEDQNTVEVVISEVHDDKVVLDANHPLAGQDLIFDLELVEIT